jgi:uncharacterized repeat protein (TIGR01451 family)
VGIMHTKTKNFTISRKARWSLGGLVVTGLVALLITTLSFQRPMEVYASTDPGLGSGNATVDRTSVPGQTILLYRTNGNSTFKAPAGVTDVRVMAIGGGGGGGSNGGGGGAGRMVAAPSMTVTPGTEYAVTVGGGGAGATPSNSGAVSGGSSSISSLVVAPGGGAGGSNTSSANGSGSNGGSGGGVGRDNGIGSAGSFSAGLGNQTGTTPGGGTSLGNNGGSSTCTGSTGWCGGSGGGGAGAVGGNSSGNSTEGAGEVAGIGGAGSANNITGSSVTYAGGGGGGRHSAGTAGAGGSGGGGAGSVAGAQAGSGTANTGSGGGGGGFSGTGGAGGSGIIVIRFTTQTLPDPGGVSGTAMWYKADSAGNTNAQWNDVSGFGRHLTQGTAADQPALTTNSLNFNPAYVFDGTTDVFRMNTQGIGASESMSVFYAANSTNAAGGDRYFNEFGDDRPSITIYNAKPRLYVRDTSSVDDVFGTDEALQPHVFSFVSPNGGGSKVLGVDNREQTKTISGSYTMAGGATGTSFGNRNASAGTGWSGPIAEAIYFNRQLNAVERQKVNSYLAIKYGITLGSGSIATDYFDSASATVWPADTTFKNNIAGIGRDDSSTLNQKQSKSSSTGSLVAIGHGGIAASNQANSNNFTNDKTFMLWGHNGATTDQATAVSGTSMQRMGRIWKAVVTNTVGATRVQIPTSIISRNSAKLLVSSSTTFDNTSQQITMSTSGSNYEANMTLTAGTHYFTFASEAGADIDFVSKIARTPTGTQISAYTPGQPIEYNLSVRNNGPDAAGTITVTDTLPAGIVPTAGGATGDGWTCNIASQTVTCTRSALAAGVTAQDIIIEATIASSVTGQKINTATASEATDPDTSNNSASVTLDASPVADLSLTKQDMTAPVAGNNFDYKFTVTNNGPSNVASYTLTDTLPADLTYVSASPAICGGSSDQNVSCAGGALASGASVEITLTVNVDAGYGGGDLINTATVAVPAGTTDPNAANNSSTNNTSVDLSTDLTISKSHAGDFIAGDNNTFTINVTNNGPSNAPSGSITVTDTLDEDFAFVSATGTNWACTHTNGTVTCTYNAALTASATSSNITLTVLVDPIVKGSTTNVATVAGTTPDPNTTNNSSTDNITIVAEADLAITKDHVGTTFTASQEEQYTFSVVNNGPSADAPSYTITDTLPAGLTFVSASGDATCSAVGQDITCTGGGIGVGDPDQVTTVTVAVDAAATGSFNNSATVTPDPSVTDPTPGNNTDSDTVNVTPNADLAIVKTHTGDLTAGDNEDYTIQVTNNGPTDVASFTVTDTLDANLTFVSGTGATCNAVGQDVTCTGGALTNGNTANITLTVTVASTATGGSTISNTADVAVPAGMNDPTPGNNTSTANNAVDTSADLSITKSHTGNFSIGSSGTFTITATNNGPSDASTATITDVLPDGFTYVDATSAEADCSNSGQTVTCLVGPAFSNGEVVDITLEVAVDADVTASSLDNTATVSSATSDPDSANNTDTDTVTLDPAEADLETTKTLQGTMTAGETATYRFEITNNGPDNAGAVTISDTLESYLSYESFTSVSGGTWDCDATGQNVTCNLPLLNNGDTAVVDVVVMVAQDAPTTADNAATVTFNGIDASVNNPATTDDPVDHEANLDLQVAFDSETYQSGDTATLTYTITNHGPSAAENVVLTDTLPDGLTFESMVAANEQPDNSFLAKVTDTVLGSTTASAAPNTPFNCSNNGQDINCTASTLFTGTYIITLTAKIASSFTGSLSTVAQLTSSTFDPNGAVVSASATATVTAASGLAGTGQNLWVWLATVVGLIMVSTVGIFRYCKSRE